jgi:hypothetical protein
MEGGCTCGHIRYRLNGKPLIWSDEAKERRKIMREKAKAARKT